MSDDEKDKPDKTELTGVAAILADPEARELYLAKLRAETEQVRVETLSTDATRRFAESQAHIADLAAQTTQRDYDYNLASDQYHNVYQFTSEVSSSSVGSCISALTHWSRLRPGCDIEVIFNSPGGAVIPGMALFDFLLDLRAKEHKLTTVALGHAASMAGILLQAGEQRVMGREAWLLIHEIQFSAIGKIGEIEDTTEWVKKIQKRVLTIFASRSRMTVAQLEKKWKRTDWWLDSAEALRLGIVDEVR